MKYSVLLLASLFITTGCTKDNFSFTAPASAFSLAGNRSLIGVWEGRLSDSGETCLQDADYANNGNYMRLSLQFLENNKADFIIRAYSDSSCSILKNQVVKKMNLGLNETQMQFETTTYALTFFSAEFFPGINLISYCGLTHWQQGVSLMVNPASCNSPDLILDTRSATYHLDENVLHGISGSLISNQPDSDPMEFVRVE